ncbi:MAG: 2-amino-4-hydroxy-6-hydroxymethyldihydropteridine diphosphokinase [Alphaproteobacteria bacterium]|nr:2-amino-4-hydroxy-6-hydroxymethyldihydropteridine diphosphokinase [Alphaproteobacteria bacterium]MDE2265830.1 2-amino-4-hydroxy-6-hydroxymethyldihydropteridine diphosphokinase [Alphaproteobacteria bacterium]MDE2500606.1 2-amino-4-hydroxy-6-hydroxymethyldihydropteridine diphosphokinase [Alphaproteobacteria bacterium]
MVLIALGANLASSVGAPAETIAEAIAELSKRGMKIAAKSRFFATPAWPDPSDPPFVNAVIRVETSLSSAAVMNLLHEIESAYGRTRSVKNAPRTLDLDLIDFDGRIEDGPPMLPHPRVAERAFVLIPLADVAPHWRHPVSGKMIEQLIAALPDRERTAVRPLLADSVFTPSGAERIGPDE